MLSTPTVEIPTRLAYDLSHMIYLLQGWRIDVDDPSLTTLRDELDAILMPEMS